MVSFKQFAKQMRELDGRERKRLNRLTIAAAIAVLRKLIELTPVDTSRAVSNWQVAIGVPVTVAIEPYVLGARGSSRGQSSSAAIRVGITALKDKKPGESVFISNLVDYIEEIDYVGYRRIAETVARATIKLEATKRD